MEERRSMDRYFGFHFLFSPFFCVLGFCVSVIGGEKKGRERGPIRNVESWRQRLLIQWSTYYLKKTLIKSLFAFVYRLRYKELT